MLLSACSSAISSWPITLIFDVSMPRSAIALPKAPGCAPPGTNTKIAARLFHAALERLRGVMTGAIVGDHGVDLFDTAVLHRPLAEGLVELRNGQRRPRHVRRLGGDGRRGRVHHHHEFLGFFRDVAGS